MAKNTGNASGLRPLYSFDQLVVGPHNHVANAACHEVANKPGEVYNPLFIYGPSGVGKTHLMHATAHEILKKNPDFRVRYISAERFVSEILMAISEDKVLVMRKEYGDLDLLIIDDVQYLSESKMSQDELFHIFNNLQESGSQVILAADRPPNQLTALNKSIRSRLEWGLSTDVTIPAEPTRLEILRRKQDAQGLKLSDEMLMYVARNLQSNVRELEGFLKRIHAYVTLSHQEITIELVRAVLKEILPEGQLGAMESTEPAHSLDKAVKNEVKAKHTKGEDVHHKEPRTKEKEKEKDVLGALSEPVVFSPAPISQEDSFDLMIDSMSMGAPPAPPLTPENGKNGHHKPAARSPLPTPPDVSLPPPALPPSAPSNLSFDILLESMNINAPEAPSKKTVAPTPVPPPPTPATVPVPPAAKINIPPATPPPAPKPISIPSPVEAAPPDVSDADGDDSAPGQKEVSVVFFYPEGCKEALQTVQKKFQEVIKKHKLKFRMKFAHNEPYSFKGKINYASFVDVCKANKVPVTVVIGPPPDTFIPEQDFYDLLTVTLDVQGVSLQLVNWGEINKDYRYLNLALDIALVRAR